VRELRLWDRVFLFCGGLICLLWPLSDLTDMLRHYAAWLRETYWTREAALAMLLILGCGFGFYCTGLLLAHANALYLSVQPLSQQARRRMAAFAAFTGSLCTASAAAVGAVMICKIILQPDALIWGLATGSVFVLGAGFGLTARLRLVKEAQDEMRTSKSPRSFTMPLLPGFRRIDRANPAWLGSWAIGLAAGRLPLTAGRLLGFSIITLGAALLSVAGLGRHQAGPAAAGAVFSGFAAFMLVVRCQPLDSPVLRSAPIGFMKTWLGVLRLPALLSVAFFVIPAGAAIAAEPSSWAMPASGCFGLFVLDGIYAIFAAFFLSSPLLAAISFFAVVFCACYEWVIYHAVVYACFAGLLMLMWTRIRRSFYHGG
jgi:hypothetical protein